MERDLFAAELALEPRLLSTESQVDENAQQVISDKLYNGLCEPAIVIDDGQEARVAVYCSRFKDSICLQFSKKMTLFLKENYNLKKGLRLLAVNTYADDLPVQRDLENSLGINSGWTYVHPIIAETLAAKKSQVRDLIKRLGESVFKALEDSIGHKKTYVQFRHASVALSDKVIEDESLLNLELEDANSDEAWSGTTAEDSSAKIDPFEDLGNRQGGSGNELLSWREWVLSPVFYILGIGTGFCVHYLLSTHGLMGLSGGDFKENTVFILPFLASFFGILLAQLGASPRHRMLASEKSGRITVFLCFIWSMVFYSNALTSASYLIFLGFLGVGIVTAISLVAWVFAATMVRWAFSILKFS